MWISYWEYMKIEIDRDRTLVAVVFAITLWVKCVLLHYFCFGYIAVKSLWLQPLEFLSFYSVKLFPSVLISSFVFISKRQWWTIVVSLFVDIWIVSNFIYFRSYGLFLTYDVIAMADNLSGFVMSILTYLNWKVSVFFFISIVFAFFLYWRVKDNSKRNILAFSLAIFLAIILLGIDTLTYTGKVFSSQEKRFIQVKNIAEGNSSASMSHYIESSSILHYLPTMVMYKYLQASFLNQSSLNIEYTDREKEIFSDIVFPDSIKCNTPNTSLYVLLVESFESWPILLTDENHNDIMPFCKKIISCENVCYASKVRSQVKYGNSGDGQMIVNTGMLPIQNGAACMVYGKNKYPNFAHLFDNSINVNAASNNVWNQYEMNQCYSYNSYVFPKKKNTVDDADVFQMGVDNLPQDSTKVCMQLITISMHVPFDDGNLEHLTYPAEMPDVLQKYLNCVHYTDGCINNFIEELKVKGLYENATIVITGDHTVFRKSLLQEFKPFVENTGYPISLEESFCPLIIISPNIVKQREINEMCYQMDIFPTILHSIGVDNFVWKGFGVNLLDTIARQNRRITEEEAYGLSDKMIRSDYFRHYYKMN